MNLLKHLSTSTILMIALITDYLWLSKIIKKVILKCLGVTMDEKPLHTWVNLSEEIVTCRLSMFFDQMYFEQSKI